MNNLQTFETELPSDDEVEGEEIFQDDEDQLRMSEISLIDPVTYSEPLNPVFQGPQPARWREKEDLLLHSSLRFRGKPGITVWARQKLGRHPDPFSYFNLFLDTELCIYIVNHTNLYVAQLQTTLRPHWFPLRASWPPKIFNDWKGLSLYEFHKFLGITIWMGLKKYPSVHDYWVNDAIFESTSIPSIMTRERFKAISRAIKLNDNTSIPASRNMKERKYAKAFKFLPFAYMLRERFEKAYTPQKEMAYDEMMTKMESRYASGLSKVVKNKPISKGIRKEALADSTGYVWTFAYDLMDGTKTAERVLETVERLPNKGHHIYFDNLYSSTSLFQKLRVLGFDSSGTWRRNYGVPACLLDFAAREQGQWNFASLEPFLYGYSWLDSKHCFFLTTRFGPEESEVLRRKRGQSERARIRAPVVGKEYNDQMGYIDQSDSMRASYTCHRT